MNKCTFDILDTPTSNSQKQEYEYRKIRETKINFIKFKNNQLEGLVYDFMIENKKVQEKVGSVVHDNSNSFSFHLTKNKCIINGKCKNQPYEEGDNDLYWLNCKNGKFYVIPEHVLIENEYIGKNSKKENIYLSPTNENTSWANYYLFDYNNVEKDRLMKIINLQ